MKKKTPQILLTNDDSIQSPGLWSAAAALDALGYVTVAAPREQFSGAGRSLPLTSDGIILENDVTVNGKQWKAYSIGGTPAQSVLHGVLEIISGKPDLVVSGINYGDNVGTGVTISGTVGAALEAAAMEIPALAISLEVDQEHHLSLSEDVDFSVAAHFTQYFAGILLSKALPLDVDVLKVDIPCNATIKTPWEITRVSRVRLYEAKPPIRDSFDQKGIVGYQKSKNWVNAPPGSDVHAVRIKRVISVTPLSLDLTSRVDLETFKDTLIK